MIFTSPFPPVTIPAVPLTQFVFEHAARYPSRPALIDGPTGRTLTYGQLTDGVRRVAAGLAQRGFKAGDTLAIFSPNLPEYAIAFHAVASLGGINTTVNPLYTVEELAAQLRDSGASLLLTVPAFLDKSREAAALTGIKEIFVFGEGDGATPFSALLKSEGQPPAVTIDTRKDIVVLPYSSGTTGLPKGVMLTHYNLVANVCQAAAVEQLSEKDTLIGVLPFYHIYGMLLIMNVSLRQGATVVTMPRFDPEQFLQIIQDHKVTRMHLVPPILLFLAKHPLVEKFNLSSLQVLMSGAAPLSVALSDAAAARLNCVVKQAYGLTETSPATHITPDNRVKPGAAGPCVPNTECQIVDLETNQPVGADTRGEVWLRGPQVMLGYLNNPNATASMVDSNGWLHSGDIGYCDSDGYLYVVDRLKELIKYKGYQVAPAELEALLLTHPDISDAAVIPKPDAEAGEIPKAFVVVKPGASATEAAIMDFVAAHVSPQKRVREIEFIDAIPKSASGKILRRILVDKERAKSA